jgi:hypothetical protein
MKIYKSFFLPRIFLKYEIFFIDKCMNYYTFVFMFLSYLRLSLLFLLFILFLLLSRLIFFY